MAHYLSTIGIFWLIAAFWISAGLPEAALWAGLLPGVWLSAIPLFRS